MARRQAAWRSTSRSTSSILPFRAGIGLDPTNRGGPQTSRNYAWRDYGNRIGNWRLFEILDELKLPASILLNSAVCYHYPEIVEKIKARGDDVLGHGRTNAELMSGMWEDDERRVIQECTDVIEKYVGVRPTGWMGPGAHESNVTPDLLKEAGYTHLLDWPIDDQPIWMKTRSGPLLVGALSDGAQRRRHAGVARSYRPRVRRHDRRSVRGDARSNPRSRRWCSRFSLHGFIVGQPFRLRPLRQAIKHCAEHKHKDRDLVHARR